MVFSSILADAEISKMGLHEVYNIIVVLIWFWNGNAFRQLSHGWHDVGVKSKCEGKTSTRGLRLLRCMPLTNKYVTQKYN